MSVQPPVSRVSRRRRVSVIWVIPLVAALSVILALTDSIFGSIRLALVSWLWVAVVVAELLWWPRIQARLLSNAERAQTLARQVLTGG